MPSYDVVIVGGGPVGMALAIELAINGVHCAIVERHQTPQQIPKGQNLTQRTMEHMWRWGVEEQVRAARSMPAGYATGGMTAYGTILGPYAYSWWQRSSVRPYYYRDNERLPQYRTESVLRARADELSLVQTWIGWTATGLEHRDSSAAVEVADEQGRTTILSADYVVGCDGSRSMVRQRAGIEEMVSRHDRTMALVVFRSAELTALLSRHPESSFFNAIHPRLDGYWQFLGRVDTADRWFFHVPVDDDLVGADLDVVPLLHAAVGAEFAVDVEHVGFWDLRTSSARRYRKERVFLAGDAAHSHPPYGGFGINLGFEDARNLGWKLAAVIHEWADPALLDSYDAERRPVFESTSVDFIDTFVERDSAFLRRFDPDRDIEAFEAAWRERAERANHGVNAFEPHYEGSSIVFGPPGAVCGAKGVHQLDANAGHHLSPRVLSDSRSVSDALGQGFTLLAFDASGAADIFEVAASELGVPLTVVQDSHGGECLDYEAQLVLVRPDHYVGWVGDAAPPNPAEVLARCVGFPAISRSG